MSKSQPNDKGRKSTPREGPASAKALWQRAGSQVRKVGRFQCDWSVYGSLGEKWRKRERERERKIRDEV